MTAAEATHWLLREFPPTPRPAMPWPELRQREAALRRRLDAHCLARVPCAASPAGRRAGRPTPPESDPVAAHLLAQRSTWACLWLVGFRLPRGPRGPRDWTPHLGWLLCDLWGASGRIEWDAQQTLRAEEGW